jgi:predicted nucleic acid-binding protein
MSTLTVLFTDLVGSTALMTEHGDHAFDALLAEHDTLIDTALAAHDGVRVKHTGDGVMAVFTGAADGLNAAVAIQQAVERRNRRAEITFTIRAGFRASINPGALHLIDLEVTSAWRRLAAAGDLDNRRAQLALEDLRSLRLDRVPHGPLVARCWELRENLTVYDAAYVAVAEMMDVVLVSADARLAGASGPRCDIELIA